MVRAAGGALAHAGEDEDVEEVHGSKDEGDDTEFDALELDHLADVAERVGGLEGDGDVADVDEVEADDEELVDGVGEGGVAVEGVEEEDASVAVQGACDPNGEAEAKDEVEEVAGCDVYCDSPYGSRN